MSAGSSSRKEQRKNFSGDGDSLDLTSEHGPIESPIDLTGSDAADGIEGEEDEDLKLAIALSLQDEQEIIRLPQSTSFLPDSAVKAQSSNTLTSSLPLHPNRASGVAGPGLTGLDRKQMEAERLARLKRKRQSEVECRHISSPPLRRDAVPPTAVVPLPKVPDQPRIHSSLQYPSGKILLTSTKKDQRQSTSLTDLLKPTDSKAALKSALLSAFMFDFDWLLPQFDTRKVSFVLVLHARNKNHKSQLSEDFAGIPNVRLTFPYVGGNVHCMHSKITILFYEQHLNDREVETVPARCRIIIPSANLVPWDYGVDSVMENTLFVIDLPPKATLTSSYHQSSSGFKKNLIHFLQATKVPVDVVRKLDNFDFGATTTHGFVHTIGGSHILTDAPGTPDINQRALSFRPQLHTTTSATMPSRVEATGLLCLSETIRSLGLSASTDDGSFPPRVDYVTSSVGSLKESFLTNLFLAACGSTEKLRDKFNNETTSSSGKPVGDKLPSAGLDAIEIARRIGIYFPSEDTVRRSKGGLEAAGTLFFQPKWSNSSSNEFLGSSLHDCVGVRNDGILMHSKIIFLRFSAPKEITESVTPQSGKIPQGFSHKPDQPDPRSAKTTPPTITKYAGWIYVGSANLSESAWGSIVTDSKTKQPKLSCRNWESGVVIPVPLKPEHEGKNPQDLTLEEVFSDVILVPVQYPGINMLRSGRKPWSSSS